MPARITVLPVWEAKKIELREGLVVVSTVSHSKNGWERELSPFNLGPCELYDGIKSKVMENAWQYSKVYPVHAKQTTNLPYTHEPTDDYWDWAEEGWNKQNAVRYPMGKGKKPLFSWWEGKPVKYISARKKIYGPLYIEAVRKTMGWEQLKVIYKDEKELILLDYDAYDHRVLGYSLTDVLECPHRKMGHAFVLMMLLKKDKALNRMEMIK